MRNTIIVSVLVFAVGLAAILVFARNSPNSGAERETTQVTRRPDCPPLPIGDFGMECLGGALTGESFSEVTVVNVWAWWCQPCREELPLLQQLATEHPNWGVVGVHADPNAANGAAFLTDIGVDLASYQDNDNAFASAHGLPNVVPVTVVFKGEEKVGMLTQAYDSYEELSAAIGELVN